MVAMSGQGPSGKNSRVPQLFLYRYNLESGEARDTFPVHRFLVISRRAISVRGRPFRPKTKRKANGRFYFLDCATAAASEEENWCFFLLFVFPEKGVAKRAPIR